MNLQSTPSDPRASGWATSATFKRLLPSLVLVLFFGSVGEAAVAQQATIRVGVVVDGPWEGNAWIQSMTKKETLVLTEGEFDVRFPDEAYLIGDWTYETAQLNIEQLMNDPEVDLIVAWGLLASHAICCYVNIPKPVVAPVIVDHELQGLPFKDGSSGIKNLSYVSFEDKVASELVTFQRIVPFKRVAFLGNGEFFDSIPMLRTRTAQTVEEAGFDLVFLGVEQLASEVLDLLTEDFDAVYVWPLFSLSPGEFQKLIDGINQRKLPSFSGWGSQDVEAGLLASTTSDEFFPRLARRVGLNIQRILLGDDAGSIPVDFSFREETVINMATARAIGVSPAWDVLVEARLLHPEQADLPAMSLPRVVNEAVVVNLDLRAREKALAAAEQEINKALAAYRPQLDISFLALQIDKDRARASLGQQPERSLTGSAGLSQLVFSDPVLANINIQRHLQMGREYEFDSLRLDIALDSSVTYLNLLRAKSLLGIQRRNLQITRSNLELAEIRRTIGTANPAEVLRWDSQIATDRKAVVDAVADERVAEIALNRLLDRDLEQRFLTEEVNISDPTLITGQDRFTGYIETPHRFKVFSDFMVQEGLAQAPELFQLNAIIAAQERLIQSTKRAYWAPNLGFEAAIDERFKASGEGSVPGIPGQPIGFPFNNDTSWSLGLAGSLPLYQGGSRAAERVQAELDLHRLRLDYESLSQRIDQRIRSGMQLARASFSGITLAEQAFSAASKSLELVSDAYARGAVSILDLLDAQRNALNSDRLVTNAKYDFFVDLMEVQRAANRSDFFMTQEQRDLWFERLERYFEVAQIRPLEPSDV